MPALQGKQCLAKHVAKTTMCSENSQRYSQVKEHHQCQQHQWKFAMGVTDTLGKFAAGVIVGNV